MNESSFEAPAKPADRALMRKEGANEKRINPNLSFPSTAKNVKFHQLYIFKINFKVTFPQKDNIVIVMTKTHSIHYVQGHSKQS